MESQPKSRRFSLANQAKAVAVVLREEFGVSFTFYDAVTAKMVASPSEKEYREWEPPQIIRLAAEGRGCVTLLPGGSYQLVLPVYESGQPILVATGLLPALARTQQDMAQEQARLQKWLQSVCDRLRANQSASPHRPEALAGGEGQAAVAWEAILTLDQLIRHLRTHKEPAKNRKRILQAAANTVRVETLMWVPQPSQESILIVGEPFLAPWEGRQLAALLAQTPDWQKSGFVLCNRVPAGDWVTRFPKVTSLMAFPVLDQATPGWVIALNKEDKETGRQGDRESRAGGEVSIPPGSPVSSASSGFRRSDAALLIPFVALLGLHGRASARYCRVKELLVGLTRSLTAAIDAKDSYTAGHSERVARIAVELGRELHLKEDELSDIYLAGLLHDIGKIGIRDTVLCKQGRLTPEEFDHIKEHVTIGYKILADLTPIHHLLPGVLYHHERYDGTGYPHGLKGDGIPFLARILAVADGYDAMSTVRPYREAMPLGKVEEILREGAGIQWDQPVVEALMRCRQKVRVIRQRGVGESLRQALDGALRNKDSKHGSGSSLEPETSQG